MTAVPYVCEKPCGHADGHVGGHDGRQLLQHSQIGKNLLPPDFVLFSELASLTIRKAFKKVI